MPAPIPRGGARFWLLLLLLLIVAAATLAGIAWRDYQRFADAPLAIEAPRSLDHLRGASYKEMVRQLRRQGLTRGSPFYWRLLAREMGVASRLQAGEYALVPGMTPRDLLAAMASGRVVQHAFTIVDGWTFRQLRLALAGEGGLEQTLPGLDEATVAARLGIDGSPEGWFLPETYAWVKGESDADVLRRALAATRTTLDAAWPARDPAVPLATPYEALILASIIEKETGIAEERAEIAGVFARRLKLGMRLQTDPTVVYGLGEAYDGNIRRRDLDADTPYNTYTRAGLPPTPIAMAGARAIEAALHPSGGNALYFVAVGDGSGRHVFSATLAEHNRAVADYVRRSRQ
ncbi:MAG: endolytic transglycosylase MltG [Xanthomonadales bacterium]|nr:endolytic transglycosylase MltG [Xanthomonadales bacterium]